MIQLTVLSQQELDSVHAASLRILDEVGIVLTHPEARSLLADAGARLLSERALLPPDLVEGALAQCPGPVTIRGRGGSVAVLGDGSLHWHNLGGAREVFEPDTARTRPALLQDVRDSARLLDALDGATTLTPFFTPQDVPGAVMSLAMYRHTLPHTVKPVHGPGVQTADEVGFVARMAEVIGPPGEVLTMAISPISPLTFSDALVEAMMETARLGIPLGPLPCPTAGATAPMSIAGALAQQNAEVLASIVLAQCVHRGLPIIYCGRLAFLEPRTAVSVWGGPEIGLASAATVQMAHRYGLAANVYGLSTSAAGLDVQNGYERAMNAILPALAGADELSGIGEMASGVAGCYAQIVCDSEIAAATRRIRRGLQVNRDALAVELVASVMEAGRNFLAEEHTVRYLRKGEVSYSRLIAAALEHGEGIAARAESEVRRLLAEHEVPPLAEEQEMELNALMEAAVREMGETRA